MSERIAASVVPSILAIFFRCGMVGSTCPDSHVLTVGWDTPRASAIALPESNRLRKVSTA